jgi:hypothetical protein
MATSTIPALKLALQTQLAGRVNLAGVQISYGFPGPEPEVEYIWLADVKGQQHLATIGTRARDETYTLTVLIKSQNMDPADQRTATERAFALMAELEAQLRTDPTVNGSVQVAQIEGPVELVELAGDASRGALLTVSVYCKARI